jgi:hypothetical protein
MAQPKLHRLASRRIPISETVLNVEKQPTFVLVAHDETEASLLVVYVDLALHVIQHSLSKIGPAILAR